ncbi:ankyrin repeat domain-containing protein [Wolbachia endosymbiont of Folsomia candida]|uniref:ankyrin repeat domain-containing protein n=1 Tax=Wolbachia endosymbiont of Folsomia candida TaxID=169402 RepID=UPI000A496335|nr:ankyrin repeat domain-containing protein [Wolbachia endosymbiont of Folsomia candida]APR98948.1 hypothetical protein ASM33_07105 [Wolbachia endosymbiont of Folsomia candida]
MCISGRGLSEQINNLREAFFQEAFTSQRKSLNRDYKINNPEALANAIVLKVTDSQPNVVKIERKAKVIKENIDKLSGSVLVQKNGDTQFNHEFWTKSNDELGNLQAFRDALKNELKSKGLINSQDSAEQVANKLTKYRFNVTGKKKDIQGDLVISESDCKKLAQKIASQIYESGHVEIIRSEDITEDIDKLKGYVLIEKDDDIQFNPKFWAASDNELPDDNLKVFRNTLKSQLTADKLKECKFRIANFKTHKEILVDEDSFWKGIKDFNQFEGSATVTLPKDLPNHSLTDIKNDIEGFFNKLVFAVNYSKDRLSKVVEDELGKEFGLIDNDYIAHAFRVEIAKALDLTEEKFISTAEEVSQFFNEARQQINRLILIGPTLEYIKKIEEFNIEFKSDIVDGLLTFTEGHENEEHEELSDFFTSQKQIFNLITEQSVLTSIKVYQAMKAIDKYQKQDSYIFMRLSSILLIKDHVLSAFEKGDLLIIECDDKKKDVQELYNSLQGKLNGSKKIILITQEGDILASKFKTGFDENCIEKPDKNNGLIDLDLTPEQQAEFLQDREVIFQGQEVSLGDLINKDYEELKKLINGKVLSKLINGKEIEIGKPLQDLGDVKDYYIPRTFNRQVKIKQEFLKASITDLFAISNIEQDKLYKLVNEKQKEEQKEKVRRFGDNDPDKSNPIRFIVLDNSENTQENFKQLKQDYSQHNIHWLKKEDNGFIWQQSQGDLSELRKFVDVSAKPKQYTPEEITDIPDKIVIISAESGMGKSTVLTKLAEKMKKSDPSLWIIRINLNDYMQKLDEINFSKDKVINFPLDMADLKTPLEKGLWKSRVNHQGKIALLFDGFDEITTHEEKVIELLQILKDTKVEKLWATTRPHMRDKLEDELGILAYTLKPLSRENQETFLKKFWSKNLDLGNINETRLEKYIEKSLDLLSRSIADTEEFIGIPLQIKMFAQAFKNNFKEFHDSSQNEPNLPEKLDLVDLYKRFVESKHKDWYLVGKKIIYSAQIDKVYKSQQESFVKKHRLLALSALFSEEDLNKLLSNKKMNEIKKYKEEVEEGKENIGIINRIINGKPSFVHRSYAEYFASDYLWEKFKSIEIDKFENRFLKDIIIENTFADYKLQIYRFFYSAAQRDFAKDTDFSDKDHKITTLLKNLTPKITKSPGYKFDNLSQSIKLLFTIVELSLLGEEKKDSEIINSVVVNKYEKLELLRISAETGCIKFTNALIISPELTVDSGHLDYYRKWHFSPFWLAAENSHINIAKTLIEKFPDYLTWRADNNHYTLLKFILERKEFDVLRSCLNLNPELKIIDVNSDIGGGYGTSLLVYTITEHAPLDVIELLIEQTNIDRVNNLKIGGHSTSAVMYIIGYLPGYEDSNVSSRIMELLVKKGLDLNIVDKEGFTPLNTIIFEFKYDSLLAPISKITKVNYKGNLFYSDTNINFFNTVKHLLEYGVIYNPSNDKTPLQLAQQMHYVQELLKKVYQLGQQQNYKIDEILDEVSDKVLELKSHNLSGDTIHEALKKVGLMPDYMSWFGLDEKLDTVLESLDSYMNGLQEQEEMWKRGGYSVNEILGSKVLKQLRSQNPSDDMQGQEGLLKRVLELFVNQNYKISEAFDEVKDEAMKCKQKLQKGVQQTVQKQNPEGLDDLILKITASEDIDFLSTTLLELSDVGKKNKMKALELMFQFSEPSSKILKLLKLIDNIFNAIQKNDRDSVEHLLQQAKRSDTIKAVINTQDKRGGTPLHKAAKYGNKDVVNALLNEVKDDIEELNKFLFDTKGYGITPLHYAALNDHKEVIDILLDRMKNNPNSLKELVFGQADNKIDFNDQSSVVEPLLERTIEAFIKNKHPTILHEAVHGNKKEIIKLILDKIKETKEDIDQYINAKDTEGNTPLMCAAELGKVDATQVLLEYEADVDVKNNEGKTALHWSAKVGSQEIVLLLLRKQADPDITDDNWETPLDLAAKGKHWEVAIILLRKYGGEFYRLHEDQKRELLSYIQQKPEDSRVDYRDIINYYLIEAVDKGSSAEEIRKEVSKLIGMGANINAVDYSGSTTLHIAAKRGNLEIVQYLIEYVRKIDPDKLSEFVNAKNNDDITLLHSAVESGKLDVVKYLIEYIEKINPNKLGEFGFINAKDNYGITPLHRASSMGNLEIVQYLIGYVEKINLDKLSEFVNTENNYGITPLHSAVESGKLDIVEHLVGKRANVYAENKGKETPLHIAAKRRSWEVVKYLIKHVEETDLDKLSEFVNAKDNNGITPLHSAVESGKLEEIKYLVGKGADVKDNETLLHSAVKSGKLEVVKYLVKKGADVNAKGYYSETPLHIAVESGKLEVVKYLVEKGADVNAKAKGYYGILLHRAAYSLKWEVVKYLIEKGADVNAKDENGKTLLDSAKERGNYGIIDLLSKAQLGHSSSQIQSNQKQQKAFTRLSKYIGSNFPEVETKSVKQGLYLPSFESRNIKIDGKCAAITRIFSQGLFLWQVHESFLANLQTSAELYERLAQGKQISSREEQEIFALSRLLDGAESELNSPTSSLPSTLSHIKSYKTLDDLSRYVGRLTEDFAIHLVTSNHVVAIYRRGNTYTYFDSNVALVSDLQNVDQLMKVVKKGVEYAGYELAEEGFLVEHFDVTAANNALTDEQKEILEKPIQTERHLLSLQDQEHGLIDVDGEKISRVTLYDMGAKLHVEASAPILINSEMNSENLAANLNSGKIKITAREYLQNLKGNKKEVVQDLVQKVSTLHFDGSINEIKDTKTIQDLVLSNDGQMLDSYQLNKILKGPIEQSIKALPYYMEVANTKHWPNRLTNAAGRISMAKGFYDIAHSIRYGDTQGFLLGSGEIGFSLFSQLIEDGIVKVAPQVIKQMKHSIFLTRGFAGLISSPFDIYDLVSSSIDLANSKKGSKEWRDSIAGVTFSGSSVAIGVAFTALGKPGAGTVIGLGIIVGQGLYSGTSMVIEYKKYKLTTNQEFRLFWHTFALQLPPEDVQYLAARKDVVNKLAEQAWEYLQNNTHVAAYGMGLGEIRFVDDTHSRSKRMVDDMEQSITGAKLRNDIYVHNQEDLEEAIKELLPKPKEVKVEPSSSSIGMSSPSNERNGRNLSRIVPVSPSPDAQMLCLPQFTHRDYEYDNSFIGRKPVYTVPHSDFLVPHWDSGYGDSPALYSNSSTAIYHCHNAIIVGRKNDTIENPTMVFDLSLVNGNGLIVSSSKYNNQFNIAQGGAKIYGSNHTSNVFTLTDDNFFGRVSGGTANATNVLDVSQLKSKGLSYENNIVTTQEAQMTAENINHFIGRKAEAEHVDCQNMNNKIVIDSRGGNSGNSDVVSNCRKVIVTGNTKVVSNESDNTFYIKPSAGHAEIRGEGKGFVIFSDTALLQRASNISYSSTNNTLSIEIKGNSGNSGTFTLDVQNYLDKENNHHYLLIDKYGSVIEPIIQSNSTHFNLKAETNLTTRAEVAQRYQEISQVNGNYTVYGVVRDTARNNMIFGSEGSDVIPLTQNVTFAQGNEESDVYSLISCEKANVTINNYDEKKALDILYLPTDSIETNRVEDDLHIATGNVTANIKVENFFRNSSYRHLTIIDKDKNTFLPWPSKQSYVQLVPFFHATKGQYMFLLSAEKVQNNPEVIVDAKLDDIRFYRYGNDLMLMDDQPLIVKVENFYGNQYGNFTLNFRSKEKLSSKQLSELAKIAINYQDEIRSSYYDSFREYRMSTFNSTIYHNQKFVNGSLTTVEQDDKRVGILLLKDPADIEVSADNNDLVFFAAQSNATFVIKNWNDTDHRVSMLRFGQEDKAIEVRKLDKFDLSQVSEIQAVINKAAVSNTLDEQLEKLDNEVVNGLKYLLASNGIVNGINTYSCLGFDSIEDQQEFVATYSTLYNKEKLKEVLQDSQVVEALRWLIAKGQTNLSLKDPDKERDVLLKDLDQCFAAKDNFTIENRGKVSVLKFNQTIEVDLSELSEIQHLISKYDISNAANQQLEELGDDEEFKYLLVSLDIENGIEVYNCLAEEDTQNVLNPYYYEWVNWNLVKNLIEENKFDVSSKADDGNTILHEAASSGSSKLDVVKYLVEEKKADVNSKANDGRTPLHHAAFSGSLNLVKYLVDEKGVDVSAKDNYGRTPLYHAASSGNLDLVKYLVEEKRVDVNTKDNYGNILLHEAASSGNLDLVKYLIDKGADVNAKTNGHWTPLHKAAEKGNEEIVLALLAKGVDVNAKTIGGRTALHWAAYKGNTETVLALLNKGANVNARTDDNETPLHLAASREVASALLNKGADINAKDSSGWTALRTAEQQGKREIVDLLNHRNTTEHQRSRRAIDEENIVSSATRIGSSINDLFGWVKSSIGGLFSSRAALPENNTTQSSISQVNAQVDVDGTILLLDVFVRKITGQKYVSSVDKSISLLEAQGYASSITLGFDTLLKRTARSCGIQDVNFNPIPVQSTIVGKIRSGNFSEISKTLYSSAKEASPEFKQTGKFLAQLKSHLEEMVDEKETVMNKQKTLTGSPKPSVSATAIESKEPSTFLNGTSIAKISNVLGL